MHTLQKLSLLVARPFTEGSATKNLKQLRPLSPQVLKRSGDSATADENGADTGLDGHWLHLLPLCIRALMQDCETQGSLLIIKGGPDLHVKTTVPFSCWGNGRPRSPCESAHKKGRLLGHAEPHTVMHCLNLRSHLS